ncbi:MAG: amylo-alpha-1,6-glucosidase [Pyrinomonadaceae bacterium]|nr:amylo-alpha-1,6-glucosidase [Pyrinomonadaceae bacterium]MCX7639898.1 amylo-alpha-1,6-glucosidase [Pyrinomonadaceae bacterium]MDW8304070.1 amylo-alpha-1,6-glucosidase [Acidobacteriota bacterium]
MLFFGSEVCSNLNESASREWLETNGLGGFACGTISGINTRRYHSYLTIATSPPVKRIRVLSKFEETLFVNGREYELSANQYPGAIYPQGYRYILNFTPKPFPRWVFEIEGVKIEKVLFMPYGCDVVVCRYKMLDECEDCYLELKPLICFVDYHSLQRENHLIDTSFEESEDAVLIKPYSDLPEIFFCHNAQSVQKTGYWYRNFEYQIEKERGFDFHEDLFQPFKLRFNLKIDAIVLTSTEKTEYEKAFQLEELEVQRRKILTEHAKDEFEEALLLAADQFIVRRDSGFTVIAGYPWFTDWGRDTMISLNGLTLITNRPVIAKNILLEFSKYISEGMIPNRFPDNGQEPEYNSVDATLWYFEAIRAYVEKTGDYDFVRRDIYEKLVDIIAWHLRGTRFQIHVDTDGLLYAGENGSQLTWMDVAINGSPVTPRIGKPVEIQALWFNALMIMAKFAEFFGSESDCSLYKSMADMTRYSFNQLFWNEEKQCLFDVVSNGKIDSSVRPNQIFAVSLPYSMLDLERARKVVERVEEQLLTPFGLRSLSSKEKNYQPRYEGGPSERDAAYHQGTVWAWLIGAFVDAYQKVFPERKEKLKLVIEPFKKHLTEGCVGQISEIFDAEPPHQHRGCFAQAWSVAEVLRAYKLINDSSLAHKGKT